MEKEWSRMKKRLFTGLLACLTVCLLAGTALGAGKGTGRAVTTAKGTLGDISWERIGDTLTVTGTKAGAAVPACPQTADDTTDQDMAAWCEARSAVKTVTISSGITSIGENAFYACDKLTTLNLPVGITTVGAHAFERCTALTGAQFSNGLTGIKESAFAGCSALASVRIPSSVTSIGANAFNRSGLTSLLLPKSVLTIGTQAFDNCSKLAAVHYCGPATAWATRPVGGPNGEVPIHYVTPSVDKSFQTCSDYKNSYYQLSVICGACGYACDQREEMAKPNHTPADVAASDATCTEPAYTAGTQCAVCGDYLTGHEIDSTKNNGEALGHKLGESQKCDHESNKEATCTASGKWAYKQTCSRCGYETTPVLKTLPPLGHDIPKDTNGEIDTTKVTVTNETKATCKAEGKRTLTFTCQRCNTEQTLEQTLPVDPDAHAPAEEPTDVIKKKATCTETGLKDVVTLCTICGKALNTTADVVIPLADHTPPANPAEKVTKQPTCNEDGELSRSYTCTVCKNDVTDTVPIPATGEHKRVIKDENKEKPATCTETGLTAIVTCDICDEKLEGGEVIPRVPHSYEDVEIVDESNPDKYPKEEATCTKAGSHYVQSRCKWCKQPEPGSEIHKAEIPMTDHVFDPEDPGKVRDTVTLAPTCTTPGTKVREQQCTSCGKWFEVKDSEEEIPALPFGEHKMGDWEILVEPTPTADGLRERHCTNEGCGYKETDVIPAQHPAHTITLDPNGGQLAEGTTNPMTTGTDGKLTAALPAPTKEKMVFVGWFTAADGGTEVTKDTVFTENTTLYAHWTEERIYAITLNANGGQLPDGTASPVNTQPNGKLASLPTPTRDGYAFNGWYTAASGGSRASTDTVFQADTTLYAHWTEKKGFTITLDGNGGTGASASVSTGTDGRLSTLPAGPTRENFDFDGWYTEKEGGTAVTTSTVFTKDTTIYARWKAIDTTTPFAIRIGSVTNGVVSASASTATRGTKVSVLVDPNSGYAVDSVKVTASGGTAVELTKESDAKYTFTMPGSAVDVTADFKSTGSGSGGSGGSNNNNNSGGAVWNPGAETAGPNPQPVPVQLSVPQISASGQTFLDIPNSHWAAGEIAWAFQQGYMNGTGGGNFSPQAPITHSQLWTVLTRLLRYSNLSESNLLAIRQGLLDGGNPAGPATRQELVTALYRCAYLLGGARTPSVSISTFGDSRQISGYAKDAMAWAVTNGIISGTADGKLNPNGSVSRAQFAVILYRFSSRI